MKATYTIRGSTVSLLSRALVSGGLASLVSMVALAALAKAEGKAAIQPINATSHWAQGEEAGAMQDVDAEHTAAGVITHHGAVSFWALLFETLRANRDDHGFRSIASDATTVAGIAAVVDYGLVPKRLTPGWELVLPKRSIAAGFAALATGLALGGLVTRPHE